MGLGTNPLAADSDGGGISDGVEVDQRGTDPLDPSDDHTGRQCSDGADNDDDGKIDLSDPGCASVDDDRELDDPGATIVIEQRLINPGLGDEPAPGFRFRLAQSGKELAFLHHGQSSVTVVTPGSYVVEQDSVPFTWALRVVSCDDADSRGDRHARSAHFVVSAAETVQCVFTNTPDLWDPLVRTALAQAHAVQAGGDGTRGYFGQILNIVCAAARSPRSECDQMAEAYAQGSDQWAGYGYSVLHPDTKCTAVEADCWVFNVFDSYLGKGPLSAAAEAAAIEANAARNVESICKLLLRRPADFVCGPLSRTTEAQAVYAGAIHFAVTSTRTSAGSQTKSYASTPTGAWQRFARPSASSTASTSL